MRRALGWALLLAGSLATAAGQAPPAKPRLRQPIGIASLPAGRLVALEAAGRGVRLSPAGAVEKLFELARLYVPLELSAGIVDGHEILAVSMGFKGTISVSSQVAIFRDGKPTYVPLASQGWYSGLGLDSATRTLYLSNTGSAEIYRLDLRGADLRAAYFLSLPGKVIGPLALDSVGQRLFAADVVRGTIYVITIADRKVQRLPEVQGEPASLAFDPATGRLYVADAAGSRIWLYDRTLDSGPPRLFATGNGLSKPCGLAVDAAGNLWVANKGSGFISSFDRNGRLLTSF